MSDKLYNHCPNCYATYDEQGLGFTIMKCNCCGKIYCWSCNNYSNEHKCNNGNICSSSSILGATKSKKQKLEEIERENKKKWW